MSLFLGDRSVHRQLEDMKSNITKMHVQQYIKITVLLGQSQEIGN